jgi:hypothetical protein
LEETIEPLQPSSLDVHGRLSKETGVVVEGGADGDDRYTQGVAILIGEDLLAWASESHEHDPGSRRTDPIHDLGFLPSARTTELRRFRPGDAKMRNAGSQSVSEAIEDGSRTSVQVDRKVFRRRRSTEPQHEVRTIDTVFQPGPVE